MEVKTFSGMVDLRPTEGRFKALICTFDMVDKGGDVVKRGAFTASLAKWRASNGRIPVWFNHGSEDPRNEIGEVNPHDCQETEAGLIAAGRLYLDEERGAKVYASLKRGTLREWSFSALIQSARPRANGGRDLMAMELVELGPTLIGKGDTATLMVASAQVSPTRLTVDESLAPYRARLAVARARVGRART